MSEHDKTNITICFTYYHLLIAIVKAMLDSEPMDLIVEDFTEEAGSIVSNNTALLERLKESNIFRKVLICDYNGVFNDNVSLNMKRIKRLFYIKRGKKTNPFELASYDNIYVFGGSLLQSILDAKKIHYNIIEDGTDCYKKNWGKIKNVGIKYFVRRYVFRIYGIDGSSPYIDSIEVNNKEGVDIKGKKIVEVPKKQLFHSLNKKEKEEILDIFAPNIDLGDLSDAILLITQPFSEDGLLKSEQDKIKLYDKIIEQYHDKNVSFIIKVHPREKTDYNKYFSGKCQVLDKNFPIELLSFYDSLRIKDVITVSSTAIDLMDCDGRKVFLGWEYLDDFKKGLRND